LTVREKTPIAEYIGNGVATAFEFDWDMLPESTIGVMVDNSQVDWWSLNGNYVVFTVPPPDGSDILIYRRTQIWMPEDYSKFRRFYANKTELSMDRAIMIAQERQGTAIGSHPPNGIVGGNDLSTRRGVYDVTVVSERGTDAVIPMWQSGYAAPIEPPVGDPVVTITSPTSNATYTTEDETVNLGGFASDGGGISSVNWVNDRGGAGLATGRETWFANNIPLALGANEITVTAFDPDNNSGTAILSVSYIEPAQPIVWAGADITARWIETELTANSSTARILFNMLFDGTENYSRATYTNVNTESNVPWILSEPADDAYWMRVDIVQSQSSLAIYNDGVYQAFGIAFPIHASTANAAEGPSVSISTAGTAAPTVSRGTVDILICADDGGVPDNVWATRRIILEAAYNEGPYVPPPLTGSTPFFTIHNKEFWEMGNGAINFYYMPIGGVSFAFVVPAGETNSIRPYFGTIEYAGGGLCDSSISETVGDFDAVPNRIILNENALYGDINDAYPADWHLYEYTKVLIPGRTYFWNLRPFEGAWSGWCYLENSYEPKRE
jgi:hypothetical protein